MLVVSASGVVSSIYTECFYQAPTSSVLLQCTLPFSPFSGGMPCQCKSRPHWSGPPIPRRLLISMSPVNSVANAIQKKKKKTK